MMHSIGARRSQKCLTAFAQEISKQSSVYAPAYRVDDKTWNFGRHLINHVRVLLKFYCVVQSLSALKFILLYQNGTILLTAT